jgi:hypothetical protein
MFYDRTRKGWPFDTGDCLIEVTIWAGLTEMFNLHTLFITIYICFYTWCESKLIAITCTSLNQGRIQNFKLGGGAHLKKSRRAEGGAIFFWVFRVKNHAFTTKKSYFFQLRREARTFLGYFVWKITILRQKKILFFTILGGEGAHAPPPGSAPVNVHDTSNDFPFHHPLQRKIKSTNLLTEIQMTIILHPE